MSDSATPKQIAFLTYMGVRGADRMTKQQASDTIQNLDQTDDLDQWERIGERRADWITDRFILHPDLYASEFQRYLYDELPELLHTYVRGQVTGSSERLTKPKIREVVQALTSEDCAWWQNPKRKAIFFERLRQTHPGCCDGRAPDKTTKRQTPQQPAAQLATAKGSGCLVLLALPFVAFIIYYLLAG
ncbi:MAG: hypothetical protein WCG79_08980 [Verrucomicrobiota bacterium]